MLITRPTVSASQIRAPRYARQGDRLLFTDALDEDSKVPAMPLVESLDFPTKGKHKGLVLVKVQGKSDPIPFERDAQVIVERQVADEQERADYLAKMDLYLKIDEVVRLRQKMDQAVDALISRAQKVREDAFPYQPFGGSVLAREAGDMESYVGQFATLVRCYGEVLDGAGITMEDVQRWSANHSVMSKGETHNTLFRPTEPHNGDCGRDGLPVPSDSGSGWTCAPLDS